MAVTVIGSLYDIPEQELLELINAKVGATWATENAHIASVVGNEVDGKITSLRIAVEIGD